jgi:hypothetical protein
VSSDGQLLCASHCRWEADLLSSTTMATLLFWRISVLRIVGNVYTAAAVAEAMVTLWTLHADAVEPKQIARFTLFAAAFAVGRFLCWSVHDRTRFGYLISRTCHSMLTLDVEGKLQ